jgi:hypothetical protein
MKIRDIVLEAPGVIDGVKQSFRQGFQQGYDEVDKVLNPKRWGEEDRVADPAAASKPINKLDLKDALKLAASGGSLYLKDQQAIKQAYAQIKSGQLATNQDTGVLLPALKSAGDLQKLSPQQQQTLTAFSQEF